MPLLNRRQPGLRIVVPWEKARIDKVERISRRVRFLFMIFLVTFIFEGKHKLTGS